MLAVPTPVTFILLALATACTGGEPPSTDPLDTADTAGTTAACPDGQLDDGGTCVPLACGSGTWGDLAAAPGDVYVQPGAQGDGSRESPISTIQAAADLAGAAGGGRVILAAGTYVENVTLGLEHAGVRLVGRCRELVFVDGSGIPETPALRLRGEAGVPSFDVEALTLTRATDVGLWVEGAGANVRSVDFDRNTSDGLLARVGAQVRVQGARMTRTRPFEESRYGRGIEASGGSTVTIEDTLVEGNAREGVYVTGAETRVTLVRTTITHSDPTGAQDAGRGVVVVEGALVELRESLVADNAGSGLDVRTGAGAIVRDTVFEANHDQGVSVTGEGSSARMVGVAVDATAADEDGEQGEGIYVAEGASLRCDTCTLRGNRVTGLWASGAGVAVELVDTEVYDTVGPERIFEASADIYVEGGATLSVEGGALVRSAWAGLVASGEGSRVEARGLRVTGVHATHGIYGGGVLIEEGAVAQLDGPRVSDCDGLGVMASGAGSEVVARNLEVAATRGIPGTGTARAVVVVEGGSLRLEGCTLRDNADYGILVTGASSRAEIGDCTIVGTRPAATNDSSAAFGLAVGGGGEALARDVRVGDTEGVGVSVVGEGSRLELSDSAVEDTRPTESGTSGYGLDVWGGAVAVVTDTHVARNHTLGLFADSLGTQVILQTSTITETQARPTGDFGRGVAIQGGAVLTATDTTVVDNREVGVFIHREGTYAALDRCEVRGTRRSRTMSIADGVHVQVGARLEAGDTTVSSTQGPAMFVGFDASARIHGGTLADNAFAGVVVLNAEAVIEGTDVRDTASDPEFGGGIGVFASDRFGPGALTLRDAQVGPHPYAAVWLDGPGAYQIVGNDLAGSEGVRLGSWTAHGNAVYRTGGATAWDGATGVRLDDNTLHDDAIAAVLAHDASALVTPANRFSGNTRDVHQQRCEGAAPIADAPPDWTICVGPALLTDTTVDFTTFFVPETQVAEE